MSILEQNNSFLVFPKWPAWSLVVLSLVGLLDSTYLTVKHFSGTPVACSILKGCETVTTSSYSTIGPLPLALLGAIFYLVIFLTSIFYLETKNQLCVKVLAVISSVGFLASAYFVFLQAFVIRAFCLYCILSAITSTLIFVLSIYIFKRSKRQEV